MASTVLILRKAKLETVKNEERRAEGIDFITQLSVVRSNINRTTGLVIANKLTQIIEEPSDNLSLQEEGIQETIDLIVKK